MALAGLTANQLLERLHAVASCGIAPIPDGWHLSEEIADAWGLSHSRTMALLHLARKTHACEFRLVRNPRSHKRCFIYRVDLTKGIKLSG